VDFDVVKRELFDAGDTDSPAVGTFNYERQMGNDPSVGDFIDASGSEPPLPNERGPKDTVSVFAEETVTIRPSFTSHTGRTSDTATSSNTRTRK
jgi:hypothetical protein